MDIVIDLTPFYDFLDLPAHLMLWQLFVLVGWIPFVIVILYGIKEIWLAYIQGKWKEENAKFVLLAIDIPRLNEQSPKAVENIFTYISGAQSSPNLLEKYWDGVVSFPFSFEIVSIEGYTQFLVYTPVKMRDLVESAIYSQYPDAEITEVNDYTEGAPTKFPDEEFDLWGTEFIQVNKSVYPIKTYEAFEHSLGMGGVQYKDPMATLLDMSSSLKKGEQLWYQIIVSPLNGDWVASGDKEIGAIFGEKTKSSGSIDMFVDKIVEVMSEVSEMIFQLWEDVEESKKEESSVVAMSALRPKQKKQIEAIQNKISKVGFDIKIRMIYLAKKEVMNKAKVVNGFVGYMKQFTDMDLNGFKPDGDHTKTSASYFLVKKRIAERQTKIINNYIKRSLKSGRTPGILNVEELASIWHFPVDSAVKAPLIQKASGRRAEPPMHLPISEELVNDEIAEPIFEERLEVETENPTSQKEQKEEDIFEIGKETEGESLEGEAPSNLPFV